jgi:hypothetical protein
MGTFEWELILIVIILPLSALYDLQWNKPISLINVFWILIIVGLPFVGPTLYLIVTRFKLMFTSIKLQMLK